MALAVALLVVGAAIVTVGAEAAVRGAVRLARALALSPFVVGAVLFGIDLESLAATVVAAGRGQTALAAGEAFGTVVFLFSAAFGAALLVSRGPVPAPSRSMVLLPVGALAGASLSLSDLVVDRLEGLALVALYLVWVRLAVAEGRAVRAHGEHVGREAAEGSRVPAWLLLAGGLALVYVGATLMVEGGVRILERSGLAAGFVGAALVGTLASLDEVLLEVLPVRRGVPALATGNLFGTLVAFTTGVLGLAALVRPLEADGAGVSAFLAAAGLYALVATVFLARGRAGRATGAAVLGCYAAWLLLAARL